MYLLRTSETTVAVVKKLLIFMICFHGTPLIKAQVGEEFLSTDEARAATNDVDFSPDGKMLATYTKDNFIALWNTETGKIIKKWQGQEGYISELDWSPDGKYLVSASTKGYIVIWDSNTGEQIVTLDGGLSSGFASAPYNGVSEVEFSPDGEYIAAMRYTPKGEIVVWRLSDFKEIYRLSRPSKTNDMGWSAEGNAIYSLGQRGELEKWSFPERELMFEINLDDKRLFDLDGTKQGVIAAGGAGDEVVVFDTKSNSIIHRLNQGEFVNRTAVATKINRMASAGGAGNLFIWDLENGELLFKRKAHNDIHYYVTFSPDNTLLATSGEDNYIRLWDVETGDLIQEISGI